MLSSACPEGLCGIWGCCFLPHITGPHTWERPLGKADQYSVDSHAEKQEVSYADAWRAFERWGYDMSDVWPQYG